MSLITAAQVREHFPSLTGTGVDSQLLSMVDRADALMAAWCGWPTTSTGVFTMVSATYVLYPELHPTSSRALWHGLRWVSSITSAYIDEEWDYGSSTQVPAADMVTDNDLGATWLRPDSTWLWSESPRANKLTVVSGFATTPPDLIAACAQQARHLLDLGRYQGQSQVTAGGQSYTRSDVEGVILRAVREALYPYVVWGSRAG